MRKAEKPKLPPKPTDRLKLTWTLVLQALGGMLLGAVLSYQFLRGGFKLAPPDVAKPVVLGVLIVGFFMAMVVNLVAHEGGHALASRLRGGTILRGVIGRWRFERFRTGFRGRRARALKGIGGFVQSVLPVDAHFRDSMTVMLLGGPFANLAVAGLAALPLWLLELHFGLRLMLVEMVVFGLILGLVNLIPFRNAGFLTDGAQLWRLWTDPKALAHYERMGRIARASLDGLRPREIDAADLAALDPTHGFGMEKFVAQLVHKAVRDDLGDLAGARAIIDAALPDWERLPDGFRQLLAVSAANSLAQLDRDPARARAWLERAEGGLVEDYQLAEVEARIADIEGDPITRDLAIQRLRQGIADTIYLGDAKVYREKLELWEREGRIS